MTQPRTKLVILGSGFAAFSLLKHIDEEYYDITVISPRNHFIFTPLLPSTTVGTIEFRSIIEPIRTAKTGIHFFQAECTGIHTDTQIIQCERLTDKNTFTVGYDLLVIGVGAVSNTYGIPGVREHALFLKDISDARAIRQRIIDCFEQAAMPGLSEQQKHRLLHFLVVGGGPTGVEFAAELHDFVNNDISKIFPQLRYDVRITLLEASDHILNTFDATLSSYTTKHFERQDIDIRTKQTVVKVDAGQVYLKDGTVIPYGLLVWSTGLGPTAFIQSLPFGKEKGSRIIVDEYLKVVGTKDIYALGDCATTLSPVLPATSQVAQQEGHYLARSFNRIALDKPIAPFSYKHLGMLAYVGSDKALADLSSVKLYGYLTWLFWRSAYLTKLVSLKNKILVLFDWLKTRVFGRDVSRF